MNYPFDPPIEQTTGDRPDASVIWLHGLGADGNDFAGIVPQLGLPPDLAIRFIFPHAPMQPVTINQGYVMRAWYDIYDTGFTRREDGEGIRTSADAIDKLIEREIASGVRSERIILAGFSQGGAIALHTGLRYPEKLGGIIALSTYLPLSDTVASEQSPKNRELPVLVAHGTHDDIVPLPMGEVSRNMLRELGYEVDWHTYPIAHSVCLEEIDMIGRWLTGELRTIQPHARNNPS